MSRGFGTFVLLVVFFVSISYGELYSTHAVFPFCVLQRWRSVVYDDMDSLDQLEIIGTAFAFKNTQTTYRAVQTNIR